MDQVLHVCHGVHSELCLMGVVTVMRHMSALAPRLWAPCDNKLVFTNLSIYLEGNTHIKSIKKRLLAPCVQKIFCTFFLVTGRPVSDITAAVTRSYAAI